MTEHREREPERFAARRPHLGVLFECCGVYARVYRHPDASCYHGRCPKCFRTFTVDVGTGGSDVRLVRVR